MADGANTQLLGAAQLTIETVLVLNNGSEIRSGVSDDLVREPGHGVAAWRHSSSVR